LFPWLIKLGIENDYFHSYNNGRKLRTWGDNWVPTCDLKIINKELQKGVLLQDGVATLQKIKDNVMSRNRKKKRASK
jgi:hypothetical protein